MNNNVKAKPFPWKCPKCREVAVRAEIVTYDAEVLHDGKTYKFSVPGLKCPQCQACGQLLPDTEANQQISQAFRLHAKLLIPKIIRGNREALGLTQKQLASALRISEAPVSRWETGTQIQQSSLDGLSRLFFQYPEVRRALMDENAFPQLGITVLKPD